ncbi:hypothetical protein AAVH_22405 [Aphelenchoides avenae]|nr:hypothetical protein AAVH_22405 [Aphelenchus avenae]
MAGFISEAFRTCTVGRFVLRARRELVLNAMKIVANTVAVAELHAHVGRFDSVQKIVGYVGSFRRVKV